MPTPPLSTSGLAFLFRGNLPVNARAVAAQVTTATNHAALASQLSIFREELLRVPNGSGLDALTTAIDHYGREVRESPASDPSAAQGAIAQAIENLSNAHWRSTVFSIMERRSSEGFSPRALRGITLLRTHLSRRECLSLFLQNPEARRYGLTQKILETVARLHQLGVTGYENGFLPTPLDEKFLSSEESRLYSLLAEYQQALEIAKQPGVSDIELGARLSIDWMRLSDDVRPWVHFHLHPEEFLGDDFTAQTSVEVDIRYVAESGQSRIVEVKTHRGPVYRPQGIEERRFLLQLLRHTLLVRQHRLEALEYFFDVRHFSPEFRDRLLSLLAAFKTPYVLHIQEENCPLATFSGGITKAVIPPSDPPVSVPEPRASTKIEEGTEPDSSETVLPWTEPMKVFLDEIWPASLSRQMNVRRVMSPREFIRRARQDVRHVHRKELLDNIKDVLASLPDRKRAERFLKECEPSGRVGQIAVKQGNMVSHGDIAEIVRLAAMVTGAISEPPPPSPESQPTTVNPATPQETRTFSERWAEAWGEGGSVSLEEAVKIYETRLATLESELNDLRDPTSMSLDVLLNARDRLPNLQNVLKFLAWIHSTLLIEEGLERMDGLPQEIMNTIDRFGTRLEGLGFQWEIVHEGIQASALQAQIVQEQKARQEEAMAVVTKAVQDLRLLISTMNSLLRNTLDAVEEAERLGPAETLTAAAYAGAMNKAEEPYYLLKQNLLALERTRETYRKRIDDIPAWMIQGELAVGVREFEDLEDGVTGLSRTVRVELSSSMQRLGEMEARIPLSPLVDPPQYRNNDDSRRVQANASTPRHVLDFLAQVPQDLYDIANSYPILSLLAPDDEVYSQLTPDAALSPQDYHRQKFDYFLSLLDLKDEERADLRFHFGISHQNQWNRHCGREAKLIEMVFANEKLRQVAIRRLTERVPAANMSAQLQNYLKTQKAWRHLLTKGHDVHEYLSESRIAHYYLEYFSLIMAGLSPETADKIRADLTGGTPLEELAPELKTAGWSYRITDFWTDLPGEVTSGSWKERLAQSHLLSTPQRSYLVISRSTVRSVSKFLTSKLPPDGRIFDDLAGEMIPFTSSPLGYRLVPVGDLPPSHPYAAFMRRLMSLADHPSPTLDLIAHIFEKRGDRMVSGFWREIVGILVAGPNDADGKATQVQLAQWLLSAQTRLIKVRELARIFHRVDHVSDTTPAADPVIPMPAKEAESMAVFRDDSPNAG